MASCSGRRETPCATRFKQTKQHEIGSLHLFFDFFAHSTNNTRYARAPFGAIVALDPDEAILFRHLVLGPGALAPAPLGTAPLASAAASSYSLGPRAAAPTSSRTSRGFPIPRSSRSSRSSHDGLQPESLVRAAHRHHARRVETVGQPRLRRWPHRHHLSVGTAPHIFRGLVVQVLLLRVIVVPPGI